MPAVILSKIIHIAWHACHAEVTFCSHKLHQLVPPNGCHVQLVDQEYVKHLCVCGVQLPAY